MAQRFSKAHSRVHFKHSTTLGLQIKGNKRIHDTNISNIQEVDYLRQSVSGVNLDEEGINLIMYNQSLTGGISFYDNFGRGA